MVEIYDKFNWCECYNLQYVKITFNTAEDAVTIWNSHKIKKLEHQLDVIDTIKGYPSVTGVANRSKISLVAEWRAHNLLYWLGYERSRTAHCDLNNEPWYRKIAYYGLSLLYFGQ